MAINRPVTPQLSGLEKYHFSRSSVHPLHKAKHLADQYLQILGMFSGFALGGYVTSYLQPEDVTSISHVSQPLAAKGTNAIRVFIVPILGGLYTTVGSNFGTALGTIGEALKSAPRSGEWQAIKAWAKDCDFQKVAHVSGFAFGNISYIGFLCVSMPNSQKFSGPFNLHEHVKTWLMATIAYFGYTAFCAQVTSFWSTGIRNSLKMTVEPLYRHLHKKFTRDLSAPAAENRPHEDPPNQQPDPPTHVLHVASGPFDILFQVVGCYTGMILAGVVLANFDPEQLTSISHISLELAQSLVEGVKVFLIVMMGGLYSMAGTNIGTSVDTGYFLLKHYPWLAEWAERKAYLLKIDPHVAAHFLGFVTGISTYPAIAQASDDEHPLIGAFHFEEDTPQELANAIAFFAYTATCSQVTSFLFSALDLTYEKGLEILTNVRNKFLPRPNEEIANEVAAQPHDEEAVAVAPEATVIATPAIQTPLSFFARSKQKLNQAAEAARRLPCVIS